MKINVIFFHHFKVKIKKLINLFDYRTTLTNKLKHPYSMVQYNQWSLNSHMY